MLNIDEIVKLNLFIQQTTSSSSTWDKGLIIDATPDDVDKRVDVYESAAEVAAAGYAADSPEYKAALAYFSAQPAPSAVLIGHRALLGDPGDEDREAETYADTLAACIAENKDFYGVYFCDALAAEDIIAVAGVLDSWKRGMLFYAVTDSIADATDANGTLAQVMAAKTNRAIGIVCTDADDAAALMGTAMGKARAHESTSFSLFGSSVPGATVYDNVTQTQVDAVHGLNGNIYVARGYTHNLLEKGAVASGLRFDEVFYLDQIVSDCQDALVGLIVDSDFKLAQTAETSALFDSALATILEGYYGRGILATAAWRGQAHGALNTGDSVEHGYYIYMDSYDNQSQADREAKKAVPITVCLCLSGSVESVELNIYAQR